MKLVCPLGRNVRSQLSRRLLLLRRGSSCSSCCGSLCRHQRQLWTRPKLPVRCLVGCVDKQRDSRHVGGWYPDVPLGSGGGAASYHIHDLAEDVVSVPSLVLVVQDQVEVVDVLTPPRNDVACENCKKRKSDTIYSLVRVEI